MVDTFYSVVSWITHDGGLPVMCAVLVALGLLFVILGRSRDRAARAGERGVALGLAAARSRCCARSAQRAS